LLFELPRSEFSFCLGSKRRSSPYGKLKCRRAKNLPVSNDIFFSALSSTFPILPSLPTGLPSQALFTDTTFSQLHHTTIYFFRLARGSERPDGFSSFLNSSKNKK